MPLAQRFDMDRVPVADKAKVMSVPAGDVAVCDWSDLLGAVKDRLREVVEECPLLSVRANVLDCVLALDQLHATAMHELGRGGQIEAALSRAQAELARARVSLAGPVTPAHWRPNSQAQAGPGNER
jgi:hypothetical protein